MIHLNRDKNLNRREFFSALVRVGIAAGIAAVSGMLILGSGKENSCTYDFACGKCGVSDRCALPAAIRFREENKSPKKRG